MYRWMLMAVLTAGLSAPAASLRYWIEPCTSRSDSGCQSGDPDLAQWALEAWQAASHGALRLVRTDGLESAHIRIYWADGRSGLYGEARPIWVNGVQGAEVYVLPAIARTDDHDPLLRDAIVYLTCLHETGHALGLPHTAAFVDIMYNFQYGGDIAEYFGRYRRQLAVRNDIRKQAGISAADQKKLQELWK
jgi:hypothetical protein